MWFTNQQLEPVAHRHAAQLSFWARLTLHLLLGIVVHCRAQGFSRLDDGEGFGIGNIRREDLDLVLSYIGETGLLSRKSREHLYDDHPCSVAGISSTLPSHPPPLPPTPTLPPPTTTP